MKTVISSKGQIVLPAEFRKQDRIRVVDWLLACPEKGWFQPVSSESTETL